MRKKSSARARARTQKPRTPRSSKGKRATAKPRTAQPKRVERSDEAKAELAFETGRYWRAPGKPMPWHKELEELYIRANEVVGCCSMLKQELPLARSAPRPLSAPLSPTERRMVAIRAQLGFMREHLVRVMVAGHAHEAIVAATYAKPVCDRARMFYESVLTEHRDESRGLIEVRQALDELREVLVPVFKARAAAMGKRDLRLSDFKAGDVERVRMVIEECGEGGKFAEIESLCTMNKQRFCRIYRLLKYEAAPRAGTLEPGSGTTNSAS